MRRSFPFTALALLAAATGFAQGVTSVDLLNPEETSGTIPPTFRIVDVYVDVATTDFFVGAGIRAVTENGALLNYFDDDPNTGGLQPGLFNGGIVNKFYTMLSKPRERDANARFTNAAASAAGGYDPAEVTPATIPNRLNVAYFSPPPDHPPPQSVDGYIARISVDISGVAEIPGFPIGDYSNWGAGLTVPPGAVVVLRSEPFREQYGTAIVTWNVPALNGINWAMYYIPEPTTLLLLTIGGVAVLRRR